jgi:hypothetical protein
MPPALFTREAAGARHPLSPEVRAPVPFLANSVRPPLCCDPLWPWAGPLATPNFK